MEINEHNLKEMWETIKYTNIGILEVWEEKRKSLKIY